MLAWLITIMVLSASIGGLVVWLVMDVIRQVAAWRAARSVQAQVQEADRRVQDIATQAQTEILRHVIEARVRDRYGR